MNRTYIALFYAMLFSIVTSCRINDDSMPRKMDDRRYYDATWHVGNVDPDSDISEIFPLGASVSIGHDWIKIDDHIYHFEIIYYDNNPNLYYVLDSSYRGELIWTQWKKKGYNEFSHIELLGRTRQIAVRLDNDLCVDQP